MLVHAIVHESCTDTVREAALEVGWEKNPLLHQGLEPASVLQLAFQSDALPAELPPLSAKRRSTHVFVDLSYCANQTISRTFMAARTEKEVIPFDCCQSGGQ